MPDAKMTAQMESGRGFIAALDQSGGSTPKALQGYGIEESAWHDDEAEMFALIHEMRVRIITLARLHRRQGDRRDPVRAHDGRRGRRPAGAGLLLQERGVVPFIKIDKGLEAERDGVQLMKPMPGLDALLERARSARRIRHQGALGDQLRQSPGASPRSSRQQFEVAGRCSPPA